MAYTILLVDDDRDFLTEFGESLADEYNVVKAEDGPAALALLKKPNEIDLVMIDQRLHSEKGTDIIKTLKRLRPELVIVLLTGYSNKETALDALRARVDEYLEKPVNPKQAKELLAGLLAKKVQAQGSDVVTRAKAIIEKNFEKKLTLVNCAALLCLSPKYLSRIFREQAGFGFNAYKIKVRLSAARKMLADQKLTIDQIAHHLGYQHAESFLRMFYKQLRMTPAKYRRKNTPRKTPD